MTGAAGGRVTECALVTQTAGERQVSLIRLSISFLKSATGKGLSIAAGTPERDMR